MSGIELRPAQANSARIPRASAWMWDWFTWYATGYLQQRFHAVRLLRGTEPSCETDGPLVVYVNHPSWYDPLVGLFCARRFFSQRSHFAPIDAQGLAKYRFLEKVGFFGVERHSRRGAANFLRTSEAIATQPRATIWITPQGQFTDVRSRPLIFKPGLSHLARRLPDVTLLPMALEYVYWNESKPEVLIAFGKPIFPATETAVGDLEAALATLQDQLAAAAIQRSPERFTTLLAGRVGVGGVYDVWRRLKSGLRGERFQAHHEDSKQ